MDKQHIYYFDYLRVIAAICVIFMHTAAGPLRAAISVDWHLLNIVTCFAFTAVPLFFMMSGYLLLSSEKTSDVDVLLKKRIPHLLVPLIGWTVISVLWDCFSQGNVCMSEILKRLAASLGEPAAVHFWYMYTLIAIYTISPVLQGGVRQLNAKGKTYLLVLIGLVSFQAIARALSPSKFDALVNIDLVNKMQLFGGHLGTFVLGYFLGNCKRKFSNSLLILSALSLLGIIIFGTYWSTVRNGAFDQTFQNQSAGFEILLASCIFLIFKQNFNRPSKVLQKIPLVPLSLSIYMMHGILLSIFYKIGISPSTFLQTVAVTFLNLTVCLIVLKTVATIRPLCYITTGMPYSSACNTCNWVYTYRKLKR